MNCTAYEIGFRLEQVLATKNDASLGLRQAQVEGKGRGVLVGLLFSSLNFNQFNFNRFNFNQFNFNQFNFNQFNFNQFLLIFYPPSDYQAIFKGGTCGGVQRHIARLQ